MQRLESNHKSNMFSLCKWTHFLVETKATPMFFGGHVARTCTCLLGRALHDCALPRQGRRPSIPASAPTPPRTHAHPCFPPSCHSAQPRIWRSGISWAGGLPSCHGVISEPSPPLLSPASSSASPPLTRHAPTLHAPPPRTRQWWQWLWPRSSATSRQEWLKPDVAIRGRKKKPKPSDLVIVRSSSCDFERWDECPEPTEQRVRSQEVRFAACKKCSGRLHAVCFLVCGPVAGLLALWSLPLSLAKCPLACSCVP